MSLHVTTSLDRPKLREYLCCRRNTSSKGCISVFIFVLNTIDRFSYKQLDFTEPLLRTRVIQQS